MAKKRNRKFLDKYQGMPCAICGYEETTVGHHIKTKGSGGPDKDWNIMPLCYVHHMEIHEGLARFCEKYERATDFLISKGWDKISGLKWFRNTTV